MSGAILRFQRPAQKAGWTNQELAELQRVGQLLANAGLPVASEQGRSDEGDPWYIFLRPDTDDVVAHIARIDGWYVAAAAGDRAPIWGESFRAIADALVARQPLAVPRRHGSDLFTHPVAILAAFVGMALLQIEPAQAAPAGDAPETPDAAGAAAPDPAGSATPGQNLSASPGAREAAGPVGKHLSPQLEANSVAYTLAAVASALAIALEADPALAIGGAGDDVDGLAPGDGLDTVARGGDTVADANAAPDTPDLLGSGASGARADAPGADAFGRLVPSGQGDHAGAGPGHADAEAGRTGPGGPDGDVVALAAPSALAAAASARGLDVDAAATAGIDVPDGIPARTGPARPADGAASQAADDGGRDGSGRQPSTSEDDQRSDSRKRSTEETGSQDASGDERAGQAGDTATDDSSQDAWQAVDLTTLFQGLDGDLDTLDGEGAPLDARPGDGDAQDDENDTEEARSLDGSAGDDGGDAQPASADGREALRDDDGDGTVTLTEAADVVLYDGGDLAIDGFEPGRDRLMVADDQGLRAVAVDRTSAGDLELVFEQDAQSVTFVGVTLEDFAAL